MKKLRKLLAMLTMAAMAASMLSGCAGSGAKETAAPASEKATEAATQASTEKTGESEAPTAQTPDGEVKKIAFITPQRLGDEGPVDLVYEGVKKASDEWKIEVRVVETQAGEYEESMRAMINEGCTLVVAVFPELADAVATVSKEYPEIDFIHAVSSAIGDNVAAVGCMYQDSAFVMGAMAGLLTEVNKVAFITGVDNADGRAYYDGFVEGVQYVNPEIKDVPFNAIGDFEDAITAKEIALSNYNSGCDVIFSGGGKNIFGIMEAVNEMGDGYYYLSCTGNYTTSDYYPGRIPACHYEDFPGALYDMVTQWYHGEFKAEMVAMQLKNGYFSCVMADEADCHIDQEIRDQVQEIAEKVKSGEIVVKSMPALESYVEYIK